MPKASALRIVHQRDQRRDDERRSVSDERGKLVAERLAGARRHHRKRVAPLDDSADDLFLDPAEVIETEGGAKKLPNATHSPTHSGGAGPVEP